MIGAAVVAVDVGTGSARAGVFDRDGRMLGRAERAIALHRPMSDHAEQSSEEIWSAVAQSVREARASAGIRAEDVAGLSFDAPAPWSRSTARTVPLACRPPARTAGTSSSGSIIGQSPRRRRALPPATGCWIR